MSEELRAQLLALPENTCTFLADVIAAINEMGYQIKALVKAVNRFNRHVRETKQTLGQDQPAKSLD